MPCLTWPLKIKSKNKGDRIMLKRILLIIMVSMLALGNLNYALAEEAVNDWVLTEDDVNQNEDKDDEDKYGKNKYGKNKYSKNKEWEEAKDLLEAEKDAAEEVKDSLEKQYEELKRQYEEAIEEGDSELAAKIEETLSGVKAEFDEAKADFKAKLYGMKAAIKKEYTEDELEDIAKTTIELEEQGMTVLPVENVLSKKGKFKFDVPPVVKEGRTLIPVRAISEGFGAQVAWDGETQTVTITKENITITLKIEEKIATLDGQEVALDVPAEIMNSRTVVPLRFIGESLGLTVEWDADERIIEIDEEQE